MTRERVYDKVALRETLCAFVVHTVDLINDWFKFGERCMFCSHRCTPQLRVLLSSKHSKTKSRRVERKHFVVHSFFFRCRGPIGIFPNLKFESLMQVGELKLCLFSSHRCTPQLLVLLSSKHSKSVIFSYSSLSQYLWFHLRF